MSLFAVIDTNVLLSALLSKSEDAAAVLVLNAVFDGRITLLYHEDILAEYEDVLCRARFHLDRADVEAMIDELRRIGLPLSPATVEEAFPDPDDRIFYAVVMEKRKTDDAWLVTYNLKHYPQKPFVVTPGEMLRVLEAAEGFRFGDSPSVPASP